nr:MAG: hypothetical protein [Microvirus sp.]
MAYRRTASRGRRAARRGRSVSGYSGVRKSSGVRARRSPARRTASGGRNVTVRLVMEQAAPSVAPVLSEDGKYAIPDRTVPKRAKF